MKTETYIKRLICTNCGHKDRHQIPKGITIIDHASSKACIICGCKTLREDMQ